MDLKPQQVCDHFGFPVPLHKVAKLRHANLVRDKISITMKKCGAHQKEKGQCLASLRVSRKSVSAHLRQDKWTTVTAMAKKKGQSATDFSPSRNET